MAEAQAGTKAPDTLARGVSIALIATCAVALPLHAKPDAAVANGTPPLCTVAFPTYGGDTDHTAVSERLDPIDTSLAYDATSNPWEISSAEDLVWFSWAANDTDLKTEALSASYRQTSDINLQECNWEPIARGFSNSFTGEYDGRGSSIQGLFMSTSSAPAGLFGTIGAGGLVQNLKLEQVNITVTNERVGGLAGRMNAAGTIRSVAVSGQVNAVRHAGGLVGQMTNGAIADSYANVAVTAQVWSSTEERFGGLVGDFSGGTISDSYAYGVVSPGSTDATALGGLVGGGIGTQAPDSFWDTEVSGQSSSSVGTGKTTDELTTLANFNDTATVGLTTAWAIVDGWEAFDFDSPTNYWGICPLANDGYPFLLWEHTSDPCTAGSSGSSNSAEASAGVPGIFLYVAGPVGRTVGDSPVYYGADRVAATSEYEVRVLSTSTRNPMVASLASGELPINGSLPSTMVRLPQLEPGTYLVRMTGKHTTGRTLELTAQITVGPNGTFTAIGPNIPIFR